MKVSELIVKLQGYMDEHGDLNVKMSGMDSYFRHQYDDVKNVHHRKHKWRNTTMRSKGGIGCGLSFDIPVNNPEDYETFCEII